MVLYFFKLISHTCISCLCVLVSWSLAKLNNYEVFCKFLGSEMKTYLHIRNCIPSLLIGVHFFFTYYTG